MDLKLCFALLILCSSLLYKGHGRSFKDNKRKPNALSLKAKLRQKSFHHNHHRYHHRHHHKHYPHHHRRHHEKQNKPHYHHHHHPYHDHHRDHHRYHHGHHHQHYPHHHRRHHEKQNKPHYHHHHHPYHDHHRDHHRYHHGHHHQHYPHHHRRHHEKQNKPHYHHHHPYHDHHHHHRHHHHYHNPIKHYIHHSHHNLHKHHHHHHHHPRYHPHKHHLRVHHKKTLLHRTIQRNHQDQPRSHISQPPGYAVPNPLKVHVKINNEQAVKRQSLPELLSNLGQNLMTLGKNMTIKTPAASASSSATASNSDKKGDISHGIPISHLSSDAKGSSSTAAVIPTHSRGKNVTATDLEALLHKALDKASRDDMEGGSVSGGGEDMEDEDEEKEDTNTSVSPKASESPQHQYLSFHESADKRNETLERQSANYYREDFAKEFMQRERSADKNDVEKKSEPFHGNLLKGADPKKSNLTDSDDAFMANETIAENIRDNDFQGESNKMKANQSLLDGPRSPDMNSKFEDTEVKNGLETANPVVESSRMTVTGENKSRKRKKEQAEALGSGDQLVEETRLRGDARKDESSDSSVLDEDYGSGENSGQYVNENAQSPENDQERYHNKIAKQDNIIQESANAVSGEKIDGTTGVNNAGNYKGAKLNEAPLEKDRKDSLQSDEAVDANEPKSKLANKAGIDTPEINGEHLDQGYTAEDLNEDSREDFHPFRTQSVSNDPESTISEKDVGKNYNVPDEQTNFQDFQRNQLGNPGQPVINATDDNLGENTIVQETMGESSRAQEQGTLSDNTSFIDAPSSTNDTNAAGMDTEGIQLSDLSGLSSRENTTVDDDSDEIPVYMLSSPSSTKDSFNGEESTGSPIFTAPTSSLSTSPSFSYSEPSTLTLGDGSFSSIDDPSEGDQSTFPRERIGFQKDMLDDPVEESLDAAVDTRRSNVAVAHETVADS